MGRLMAFDYGGKRTGIAVTDPLKIIATGLATVPSKEVIDFIKKYLFTEQVELFIVGEPRQMDNSPSQSAQMVNNFVKDLQKTFPLIPVERVDERFTSKMASKVIAESGKTKKERQKKEHIDTISATIILQSYMESKNY
jgi:putative holliday junction resolvase